MLGVGAVPALRYLVGNGEEAPEGMAMRWNVHTPPRIFVALTSSLLVSFLGGCDPSPTLDMSEYDRTCQEDADCVSVSNRCANSMCNCITDAIATEDVQRFRDDRQSLQCYGNSATIICRCREVNAVCREASCRTEFIQE